MSYDIPGLDQIETEFPTAAGQDSGSSSNQGTQSTPANAGENAGQNQNQQTPSEPMFKINYKGQEIEVPQSKLINTYQQAYNLDTKFKQLKQEQEAFEATRNKYNPIYEKYKPVLELAEKDPEWANFVDQEWQRKQQGLSLPEGVDPNDPNVRFVLEQSKKTNELISQFNQKLSSLEKDRNDRESEMETQKLDKEIAGIKQQYKGFNLDAVLDSEKGTTVSDSIIEHAVHNKMTFKQAMYDLYHDTIIKAERESAKREAIEEIKKQHNIGIVPSSGGNGKVGVSFPQITAEQRQNMSYNDLMSLAMQDPEIFGTH